MYEKVYITTDDGQIVQAIAPVVISASRVTDIPAFYSKWFINRLKKGYCVWINPYNRKKIYVSFKNCKAIIFWTKNPERLLPYLDELDKRNIHFYFQFTLNDYEKEGLEPGVKSIEERIDIFKNLSTKIGKDKVIWRFDPLLVTPITSPRDLLMKIWRIGNKIKGYTSKLVFSFVDVQEYKKVQSNLIKETNFFTKDTVISCQLNQAQISELVDGLVKIRQAWRDKGWDITLSTCAEEIDLSQYGIEHNHCIDYELMEQLFNDDKDFVYYLHTGKLPQTVNKEDLFYCPVEIPSKKINLKDKGQREICGCMESKDIGMYNTCGHLCVYCYANLSRDIVLKNKKKYREDKESIID